MLTLLTTFRDLCPTSAYQGFSSQGFGLKIRFLMFWLVVGVQARQLQTTANCSYGGRAVCSTNGTIEYKRCTVECFFCFPDYATDATAQSCTESSVPGLALACSGNQLSVTNCTTGAVENAGTDGVCFDVEGFDECEQECDCSCA